MSSAKVAVTTPNRSRTRLYARLERDRNHAVASPMSGRTISVASASRQSRRKSTTTVPASTAETLDEARDAVRHEQVEHLDVVRDAADDGTGAVPLVVTQRQTLKVPEELDPKVGERPLADPAREVRLRAGEDERRDPGREERGDDDAERAEVTRRDSVVDRELGEVRREQCDARVCDEGDDRERRAAAVRVREPEEHTEPSSGLAPRPVVDACTALVQEVARVLPDLHPATTCCRSPCS